MSSQLGNGMSFLRTITEGIAVALDALGANKIRSGLTILGVTIGVLVVMVMAAVITGINSSFSEIMSSRGISTFYVSHFDFTSMINIEVGGDEEEGGAFMKNEPLDPRWARELGRLPEIEKASAFVELNQAGYQASVSSDRVEISLYGTGADYLEIDNGDIVQGRWWTESESERRTQVTVIDSATAFDLFGSRNPLGRDINIGRRGESASFKVIGIYRPPANLFAGFATHYVFVPFPTADKVLQVWDRMLSFIVRPKPDVPLQQALDVTHARLRQIRNLKPGEEDDFALMTQDQLVDVWGQLTGVLSIVMVGLSSIGLLVGGVGVIGIMMISVTERTREIGLRKSLGARQRDILWQFLVEASTLTVLGGSAGMLIGGGIVWALNTFSPVPAATPLWSIIAALGASVLTGIGFGLYPASRAARLEPVDALRYE
jgi:putative ABC transport system permease protein